MRKRISICIILMVFIFMLLINLITYKNKKYIMFDGMMLAMTLTDTSGNTIDITEFPTGTNYRVEIDCGDTAVGKWIGKEWKLSISNINGKAICNINFYERKNSDKLSYIVQSENSTNNNGYRYSGANPNNYLWFNDELWRIIGLVPVCTAASSGTCSTRTNLVKIIRNNSIGGIAFDAKASGYTGVWGNNTLYTLLNNYYYGKQDGTGTSYCYGYKATSKTKCNYTTTGISNDSTDFYGKMVENVYWNIGASAYDATPSTVYGTEIATVTTNAVPIGLMSASDFGYAATVSGYGTNLNAYNTATITGTNWLFNQGNELTGINYSSNSAQSLRVDVNGHIVSSNAYAGYVVRPVLYLNTEVYKISGIGIASDPYIIGM